MADQVLEDVRLYLGDVQRRFNIEDVDGMATIIDRGYALCRRLLIEGRGILDGDLVRFPELLDAMQMQLDNRDVNDIYAPIIRRFGTSGRPRIAISEQQLQWFVDYGFTAADVARVLSVSTRTVQRRAAEVNISMRRVTPLSDGDIDEAVQRIKNDHPEAGERMLDGYLRSVGLFVPRSRLRFARLLSHNCD